MAADFEFFMKETIANQRRFKTNLEEIIAKYDREVPDDIEINLNDLSVHHGHIKRLQKLQTREIGHSKLKTFKRKEEKQRKRQTEESLCNDKDSRDNEFDISGRRNHKTSRLGNLDDANSSVLSISSSNAHEDSIYSSDQSLQSPDHISDHSLQSPGASSDVSNTVVENPARSAYPRDNIHDATYSIPQILPQDRAYIEDSYHEMMTFIASDTEEPNDNDAETLGSSSDDSSCDMEGNTEGYLDSLASNLLGPQDQTREQISLNRNRGGYITNIKPYYNGWVHGGRIDNVESNPLHKKHSPKKVASGNLRTVCSNRTFDSGVENIDFSHSQKMNSPRNIVSQNFSQRYNNRTYVKGSYGQSACFPERSAYIPPMTSMSLSPSTITSESRESGYTSYDLTDETDKSVSPFPLQIMHRNRVTKPRKHGDQHHMLRPSQAYAYLHHPDEEVAVMHTGSQLKEKYPQVCKKVKRKHTANTNNCHTNEESEDRLLQNFIDRIAEKQCRKQKDGMERHPDNRDKMAGERNFKPDLRSRRGANCVPKQGDNVYEQDGFPSRLGLCRVQCKTQQGFTQNASGGTMDAENYHVRQFDDVDEPDAIQYKYSTKYSPRGSRCLTEHTTVTDDQYVRCYPQTNYESRRLSLQSEDPSMPSLSSISQYTQYRGKPANADEYNSQYKGTPGEAPYKMAFTSDEPSTSYRGTSVNAECTKEIQGSCFCDKCRCTPDDGLFREGSSRSITLQTDNTTERSFIPMSAGKPCCPGGALYDGNKTYTSAVDLTDIDHFSPKPQLKDYRSTARSVPSLLKVSSLAGVRKDAPELSSKEMTSLEKVEKWQESLTPDRYTLKARRRLNVEVEAAGEKIEGESFSYQEGQYWSNMDGAPGLHYKEPHGIMDGISQQVYMTESSLNTDYSKEHVTSKEHFMSPIKPTSSWLAGQDSPSTSMSRLHLSSPSSNQMMSPRSGRNLSPAPAGQSNDSIQIRKDFLLSRERDAFVTQDPRVFHGRSYSENLERKVTKGREISPGVRKKLSSRYSRDGFHTRSSTENLYRNKGSSEERLSDHVFKKPSVTSRQHLEGKERLNGRDAGQNFVMKPSSRQPTECSFLSPTRKVPEAPSWASPRSPLVPVSSMYKMGRTSEKMTEPPQDENKERASRHKAQRVRRYETNGLGNTQQSHQHQSILQSTPLKPNSKLRLNETISTIVEPGDDDSSEDEVMMISPN